MIKKCSKCGLHVEARFVNPSLTMSTIEGNRAVEVCVLCYAYDMYQPGMLPRPWVRSSRIGGPKVRLLWEEARDSYGNEWLITKGFDSQ